MTILSMGPYNNNNMENITYYYYYYCLAKKKLLFLLSPLCTMVYLSQIYPREKRQITHNKKNVLIGCNRSQRKFSFQHRSYLISVFPWIWMKELDCDGL